MATLAPIASPHRQPFASLDGARLRNLSNTKNRQNGMMTSTLQHAHRHHESNSIYQSHPRSCSIPLGVLVQLLTHPQPSP